MCTPGASFCEGSTLWACTKSGADAVRTATCVGGSATNPFGCATTNCPPGEAACCRPSKPLCRWNFTSPASTGTYYIGVTPGQFLCSQPESCGKSNDFQTFLSRVSTLLACSDTELEYLSVRLPRPLASRDQVFTLPQDSRAWVSLNAGNATRSCSTWTGRITWHSDVPSWSVSFDLTCSEAGKGHLRVVGTWSGDT